MGLPFKKRFNSSLKLTKCQRETQCVKYKLREVARIMLESTGESDETKCYVFMTDSSTERLSELLKQLYCLKVRFATHGIH